MRRTALTCAAAIGGSLVLTALAPAAFATGRDTSCATLGAAAGYTEFVEEDSQRTADAEGAVAIGGDADFTRGFSLGAKLTDPEAAALPGGDVLLVVGGTVDTGSGSVEVEHGGAIYDALKGTLWVARGSKYAGPSPVEFGQAFDRLRATSATWAALPANGTAMAAEDRGNTTLTLTGTDPEPNDFTVGAAQLTGAHEIRLDLPAGSGTVVNVTGAAYDQEAAGTSTYFLRNPVGGGWVEEDYTEPNAQLAGIRSGLIWNFAEATKVVKRNGTAWPGRVLASNAAVRLGSGNVDGEIIADESLTRVGGAETHHFAFAGCIPGTAVSTHGSASASPNSPSDTTSAPGTLQPSGSTSSSPPPSGATTAPAPAASGSATPSTAASTSPRTNASLASTGGGSGATLIAAAGATALALGGGVLLVTRRKSASRR